MNIQEVKKLMGKRVLIRTPFSSASNYSETHIEELSPSGKLVRLGGNNPRDDVNGWFDPITIEILEVLKDEG